MESTMSRRGYALPFVIMILLLLSVALGSLLFILTGGTRSTESMLGRRRLFYDCDGISRIVAASAQNYFGQTHTPDPDALRTFVCNEGGGCTGTTILPTFLSQSPALSLSAFEVPDIDTSHFGPLDSGPFEGMISMQNVVRMRIAGHKQGTGWRCELTQEIALAKVGLFQFAVFSGIPIDLFSPAPMTISGRVHVNGDFCAGGNSDALTIESITASGQLLSGCHGGNIANNPSGTVTTDGFLITNRANGDAVRISSLNDGHSAGWKANALATWNGNAQDESHDVPALRLPITSAAAVQPGNNQDGAPMTNVDSLRLLVDPGRSDDSTSLIGERLYHKADLRIINGVWYAKDGSVLWSDHSGAVELGEQASLGVPKDIPSPPAGPVRYSYYERDTSGLVQNDPAPSIVSYGALVRTAANVWRPAKPGPGSFVATASNDELVDGARSGFVDRRVALASGEPAGRIVPLNFDVGAFVEALQDTTTGELGAVFPSGSFNGIIWIGHSWPNADRGLTTNPSSTTMAATAPTPSLDTNNRLAGAPLPLCGVVVPGPTQLSSTVNQVGCDDVTLPRVNAVRVHSASAIDPNILPGGLTIATNGPLYVLGDVNTSSLEADLTTPRSPRRTSTAGAWVPVMLAGDAVTMLSKGWSDGENDRVFGQVPVTYDDTGCTVDAEPTTVAAAILAGHVDSASRWGGGINNFPRFLECWREVEHRFVGSLVIGFRSVYQRAPFHFFAYRPPNRRWSFDINLQDPANQPPGTPRFDVQATRRWKR
jgi:hypothetical protein